MKLASLALLSLLCVAPAPSSLPPLPHTVWSQLGPLTVHVVPRLKCGEVEALGCFAGDERYLAVRDSVPLVIQWVALRHELCHSAFFSAGMSFRSDEVEDKICDVQAKAQVAEMLAKL